jgi:multicomponent Na+:H+ antiporter subunit C
MSAFEMYVLLAAGLFAVGLHGFFFQRSLVRKVIALNVLGAGVFLVLIAVAYRNRDEAPDPVPHAMVLTGIVVAVSATALALALARRIEDETGSDELPEDEDGP